MTNYSCTGQIVFTNLCLNHSDKRFENPKGTGSYDEIVIVKNRKNIECAEITECEILAEQEASSIH